MPTSTPIPDHQSQKLSVRAFRILTSELRIDCCEKLLELGEKDIGSARGCGRKTVSELNRLQWSILREYPHLMEHYHQPLPAEACDAAAPSPPEIPAAWSILNSSLADLFELAPIPSGKLDTVAALDLPADDLERLRTCAVSPDDSIHLLHSVATGSLVRAGLSDPALTTILESLLGEAGLAGAGPETIPFSKVPALSLYDDVPPEVIEPLFVPAFRFPALLLVAPGGAPRLPWKAVAQLTERDVVEKLGLSAVALRAIGSLWQLKERAVAIAEAERDGLPAGAYADGIRLTEGFLQLAVQRRCNRSNHHDRLDRYWQVLESCLRLTGRKKSLSELGNPFGVTREAVRQIKAKLVANLQSREMMKHLDYLWDLLDHLLEAGGGSCYLSELSAALGEALGWTSIPSDELLGGIMELSSRYRVVREFPARAALRGKSCVGCSTAYTAVLGAVENAPDQSVGFDEARGLVLEACRHNRCPRLQKVVELSKSLLHFMVEPPSKLSYQGETLLPRNPLRHRHARRQSLLETMVLDAPEGIHFKELHRLYLERTGDTSLTDRTAYALLFDNPSCLLWGHGTFIHRTLAMVPSSLILEIEQYLLARLEAEQMPYLCLNGSIFERYRLRLAQAGVPNSLALYSCLRIAGNGALSLNEYPYVLRAQADGPVVRPPITAVIEALVSSHGLTPIQQIWRFAVNELGVSDVLLNCHLRKTPNIARIGRDLYLHSDTVPAVTSLLQSVLDGLSEQEKAGEVAAERIYGENEARCLELGIAKPVHLTSLFSHFFPGSIAFADPRKAAKAAARAAKAATAKATPTQRARRAYVADRYPDSTGTRLLGYLEEQASPCKTKGIMALFGRASEGAMWLLCKRKLALRYDKDALIAFRALEWSPEKQAVVEELALRHLDQRNSCGRPYGSAAEMVRDMADELPEIPDHLSWSPSLVQGLLGMGATFVALGRKRDTFILKNNEQGVASMGDLYFYTLLTECGGSASVNDFIKRLRRCGIMECKVPTFLKGKDDRVVIEGDLIKVAGPVERCRG